MTAQAKKTATKGANAAEQRQADYARAAGALQKSVAGACDDAGLAGLSRHEQANELRTIAQRLDDESKGRK